jgi:hypothetical protein
VEGVVSGDANIANVAFVPELPAAIRNILLKPEQQPFSRVVMVNVLAGEPSGFGSMIGPDDRGWHPPLCPPPHVAKVHGAIRVDSYHVAMAVVGNPHQIADFGP